MTSRLGTRLLTIARTKLGTYGFGGEAADPQLQSPGFSEEAMEGLRDLDARLPPSHVETAPAFERPYAANAKLSPDHAAGGGLVSDADGSHRPHYWGHRERLRQRFLKGGHAPMPDYELLELLLFNAIPRIDVKPLAKRLLVEFGDLNGVVAATEHRLLQVPGATKHVYLQLRILEAFTHRMAQARVLQREVVSSWEALLDYCKTTMAHRDTEQFRILFLDRKNVLIADELQAPGTVDHVPVYPREIIRRTIELSASAIILVHNHPSGDPTPSRQDIEMTKRVQEACEAIGILLHDHVIIGTQGIVSMRSSCLLEASS